MQGKWILALALAGLLAACTQQPSKVTILSAPMADGKEHREPVFYNGRMFALSYRFDMGLAAYQLQVSREQGVLPASADNEAAARAIGVSALSHFACPTRKRAQIITDSLRHDGRGYGMLARCGG